MTPATPGTPGTHPMIEMIRHWTILLIGLTLTGLICAWALPFATSPRGGVAPSLFLADAPVMATITLVLALALAMLVSLGVGRLTNSAVGLFVMGWGVSIFAMRTDTVHEVMLSVESNLVILGIETLFWAMIVLVLTLVMFKIAGPFKDIHPREFETPPDPLRSPDAIKCAMAGLVMIPIVLLIAQSPSKGQVLMAVFTGGMMAGLIGRLVSPHVQPKLIFMTPIVAGAVGQFIGLIQMSRQGLNMSETFVAQAIPTLSLPMPIDYAGASLMGVAMGVGWARSFLHHEEEEDEKKAGAGKQTASV
ncbi:MAG: hypothetical protein O7G85_04740 [Planctomycetota bacterium]|nr:hypothetical protein [Planctomycetota bacterium]